MALSDAVRDQIDGMVKGNDVFLFMKGTRHFPQCGFSAKVISILEETGTDYETCNVLADMNIRSGIKEYSDWPTIPQLYVRGEFVGGSDIVRGMHADGELDELLGVEMVEVAPPTMTVTDAAKAAIEGAREAGSDLPLRIQISRDFKYEMGFEAAGKRDLSLQINGVAIAMDRGSAPRAEGMTIDYADQGMKGAGFTIDNPNEPPGVQAMTVQQLDALIKSGDDFKLFDVRTPSERQTASIPGSTLLDRAAQEAVMELSKDTQLVFHCHHGGRSQQAAEHFVGQGFTNVHNVAGGIDAWSQAIDPTVPRY